MWLILSLLALCVATLANQTVTLSDIDQCKVLLKQNSMLNNNKTMVALEGIVGVGWDDLTNRAMLPVLRNTYKSCKRIQDDVLFVPDNIEVVPVLRTTLERMANIYTSFDEYRKQTTDTISIGGGGIFSHFTLSGSFSSKHQVTRNTFHRQKSIMLCSKMIYYAYTLIADGNSELHPGLIARLLEISRAIENENYPLARYLSELIVRDYGTHVVFKSDVGAIVEQEIYINAQTNYSGTTTSDALRAAAAAGFLGIGGVSMDSGHSVTETDKQILRNITHHSRIRSQAGPNVNRLSDGKGIFQIDELVSFSNEGVPLETIITKANLPSWNVNQLANVQKYIRNATLEYYERNTIRGCTNASATNFNYQANLDDGSCEESNMTFLFSGVFQKCTPVSEAVGSSEITMTPNWRCKELEQVNPMTNNFTCQENYEPVLITRIVHQFPDRLEQRTYEDCDDFLFWTSCDKMVYTLIMKDRVQLDSFWCRAKSNIELPPNSGSMFGGLYTSSTANFFTDSNSCPAAYVGYRLFLDVTVCISYDYQIGSKSVVPFNGFFSCQSSQQKCEKGYTQHLVEIFDGCAVYYCVTLESYLQLEDPVIKRPPFTDPALTTSTHSKNSILAFYNGEQVMDMPVSEIIKDHIKKMETSMAENNGPGKVVFLVHDVQHTVDNYMDRTSKEIFDLMDKHPNKTWTEITSSFVDSQPLVSSVITRNEFGVPIHIVGGIIFAFVGRIIFTFIVSHLVIGWKRRRTPYESLETELHGQSGLENSDL